MSVKTELWAAFNEEHVDIKRQGVSDWSDPVEIAVPGDPWAPSAPGLSAASAGQAIDLTLTKPATNEDGSACTDFKEFEVYYSATSGIDVDDPATYDGSFITAATQHTFPATETTYFRAVAWDKHGNRSSPSGEVSATPTTEAYTPAVDDYTSNIANVYVGAGIIGIEFQPPKSTWQGWAGYKLYYDYDDGTGWTGTWTHIYTGFGPGFLHKGLNEAYAYKYKCTVIAEDGTETAGTVSDNSGNGYTPNASDNSALLSSTVMAERVIATKEMLARTFVGGTIRSANWASSAGTEVSLDDEIIRLGGSSVGYDSGAGIWLGNDSGTYKLFVGDSAGNKLTWDGSTLTVRGSIVAQSGSSISADYITGGTITAQEIVLDTDGSAAVLKSSNYSAGSAGWKIDSDGNAEFNDVTVRGALITGSGSDLNADYISAGTITAIDFKTASSGWRVEIGPGIGNPHTVTVYDDSGTRTTLLGSGVLYLYDGDGNETIGLIGSSGGTIGTDGTIRPYTAGAGYVGNATYYWYEINYKILTDRGCLGSFDLGATLPDGRRVSDVEAIKAIKVLPDEKTPYGKPRLDYSTFPVECQRPAPIAEKDTEWRTKDGVKLVKKGEKLGEDGIDLSALVSLILGAIKELDARLAALEAAR